VSKELPGARQASGLQTWASRQWRHGT